MRVASMNINQQIQQANKILSEYWPLGAFIATNPLWNQRNKNFLSVVSHPCLNSLMSSNYYFEKYQAGLINNDDLREAFLKIEQPTFTANEIADWLETTQQKKSFTANNLLLAEQVEEYHFQKTTVWIKERIFTLLRDYFGNKQYESSDLLSTWFKQCQKDNIAISLLNQPIAEAIEQLLLEIGVTENAVVSYLEAIYLQVYGWTSLMNWRNSHSDNPWLPGSDDCQLVLLFWLSYEALIAKEVNKQWQEQPIAPLDLQDRYIWQTAFEHHYLQQLYSTLSNDFEKEKATYDAQFVFCIDTRSEGLRRHLEAEGNYQTFGYAGFFGAIFNLDDDGEVSYQSPALVKATHLAKASKKLTRIQRLNKRLKEIMAYSKKQLAAPFALFEMAGIWFLPYMIFKTLQPALKSLHSSNNSKEHSSLGVAQRRQGFNTLKISNPFTDEEQLQAAAGLLKTIGLTKNFSNQVFLCAHQADPVNNPFKASLNCGACGGNSGLPNAILMCEILNTAAIREKLQVAEIDIPASTQFIPACHHTCHDKLQPLNGEFSTELQQAVERACVKLRDEKLQSLPGKNDLRTRENNWSELVPELALINNTCIIIGPRALTRAHNLERRSFLHSYEPELDPTGSTLASILSAPVIVAHWINSQYYFSTVNPRLFGAGNKAIHNVLPDVGVLEGNLSDLKVGLPLQSTHFRSKPIHEPRRLSVMVYASQELLDKAIAQAPEFKILLDNNWVYLQRVEMV
jgi:uncharacterized protein YbcC (UPF0753/DUF2309 family)